MLVYTLLCEVVAMRGMMHMQTLLRQFCLAAAMHVRRQIVGNGGRTESELMPGQS